MRRRWEKVGKQELKVFSHIYASFCMVYGMFLCKAPFQALWSKISQSALMLNRVNIMVVTRVNTHEYDRQKERKKLQSLF